MHGTPGARPRRGEVVVPPSRFPVSLHGRPCGRRSQSGRGVGGRGGGGSVEEIFCWLRFGPDTSGEDGQCGRAGAPTTPGMQDLALVCTISADRPGVWWGREGASPRRGTRIAASSPTMANFGVEVEGWGRGRGGGTMAAMPRTSETAFSPEIANAASFAPPDAPDEIEADRDGHSTLQVGAHEARASSAVPHPLGGSTGRRLADSGVPRPGEPIARSGAARPDEGI